MLGVICKVQATIMKLRDGMWLQAQDIRSEYAEEVYSVAERGDGKQLSLFCPTKKIRARSDSLNLSTLSIVGMLKHGI
jgi:alpha-D-xyloside xylohydrolase